MVRGGGIFKFRLLLPTAGSLSWDCAFLRGDNSLATVEISPFAGIDNVDMDKDIFDVDETFMIFPLIDVQLVGLIFGFGGSGGGVPKHLLFDAFVYSVFS